MKSHGIALVAGLVLLAAVSLLAVLTASGTLIQRTMAGNFRDDSLALENASIAASFALAWLNSRPASEREMDCMNDCILPNGIYDKGGIPDRPEFEGAGWWRANGFAAGYNPAAASTIVDADLATRTAHWLVEEIHYQTAAESQSAAGTGYYRILSRGEGHSPNNVVVVETITARPWEGEITPGIYPPGRLRRSFCRQFGPQQQCGVLSWRRRR